jgi:hypothetical protein
MTLGERYPSLGHRREWIYGFIQGVGESMVQVHEGGPSPVLLAHLQCRTVVAAASAARRESVKMTSATRCYVRKDIRAL